jgi:hypothetical protein
MTGCLFLDVRTPFVCTRSTQIMAGAWEIYNQQRVLVVILTRELTSVAWAFGFKNLQIPGTYTGLSGMPYDHARNTGCQKLLELGWEYVFLDDDTVPPPDAIYRLMAHKQPMSAGLYYRRNPPIVPVMLKESPSGRNWISQFKAPDLMEVDFVGSGCLLIHRDVLTTLKAPWFDWRVDRYDLPAHERMSEDFRFCQYARENGYKILVDTSVQCRHIGLGEVELAANSPQQN